MPSAVKQCALERNLPLFQPLKASDPQFIQMTLAPLGIDVCIVAAFSEILKEPLLTLPKKGCINVHASLLPKYRGAAPIQRCIMEGETESGVTIMAMDVGLDTGGMLRQVIVPIAPDMTAGELSIELAHRGAEALWEVLQQVAAGTIHATPQPPTGSCYAKKLTAEDGHILWNRPSHIVYNHIRAVTPKPGAWCAIEIRGERKRLMIRKARHCPDIVSTPGHIDSPLVIACQSGGIALLELQLEGKKSLTTQQFLNGIDPSQLKFYSSA